MDVTGIPVFEGDHLRAIHFGPTERIFVSFDFWRDDRNGFPPQSPSQSMARQGIGTLSIVLSDNSWYMTPETAALRVALDAHCRDARDVRAVGSSMGGYGAVLLSKALHLRRALLISPQFSIFPARAPWDTYRHRFARKLDDSWDDLEAEAKPDLTGALLFDPRKSTDLRHARAMCRAVPGIRAVALPFGGHPAHKNLFGRKHFWKLTDHMFTADDLPAWIHGIRRELRENSEVYENGVADYLNSRSRRRLRE